MADIKANPEGAKAASTTDIALGELHNIKKDFQSDDIAARVLASSTDNFEYTPAEGRTVLRKIDTRLLPMMMVTYCIQFLDKACVAYAALWGMKVDANLVGSQYSWLTTIFYIGYLVGEFPMNYLFQKFSLTRVCGISIFCWGVVLLCMTAANDFKGLMVSRFLLGFFEGGVSPCFVLLTGMFYKREEQPLRNGIWFSTNGIANIAGALIGYAIGFINSDLPAWKFPFVIWGSVTTLWGIVFMLYVPPNPIQAKWLTEREKIIAVVRIASNETGLDTTTFKWYQVREAMTDVKVWMLILITFSNNVPNGGVSAFGPLIINGFGYTKFESTLLNMPTGACQIAALWISGYLASKYKGFRIILMGGGLCVAILGASLVYALPTSQRIGRLIGNYILIGWSVTYVLLLGLIQSNIAGRTKKTVVTASLFVSYCVGNLIGPQFFFDREAPRYSSGFISMLACLIGQLVLVVILYFMYDIENRRRDRLQLTTSESLSEDNMELAFADLTDKENIHFRYIL
ncbi:hypothetical protein BP6252_03455 [Coleophoma cylindrospora]|uniref:Major facilitator superfamily (MFS) profile domain-containing protein n=1 Tax=Coleophoma cylindrospora TaxID=1849047 RepID=A0A3D8S7R0_9HELO|nr:hypothetical protein BP6252_03455 [Coleophoma cylindrospora]